MYTKYLAGFAALLVMLCTTAAQAYEHHGHHGYHHSYHGHHYRPHNRFALIVGAPLTYGYGYGPVYQPVYNYPTVYTYAPPQPVAQPIYYNAPQPADTRYCREFTRNVLIGNRLQSAYGTACMQPDGTWQMMD